MNVGTLLKRLCRTRGLVLKSNLNVPGTLMTFAWVSRACHIDIMQYAGLQNTSMLICLMKFLHITRQQFSLNVRYHGSHAMTTLNLALSQFLLDRTSIVCHM